MTVAEFLDPVGQICELVWAWMEVTPFFVGPSLAQWFKLSIAIYFVWKALAIFFNSGVPLSAFGHPDVEIHSAFSLWRPTKPPSPFQASLPQYDYKRSDIPWL